MAISKVAIANGALQRLGASRISSFTQDHPNARSVNACYDRVRDALLRTYLWSFAIKRESIAADADGPTWGDWLRYSLPNDYIRLIRDDETGVAVDWRIEGLYILSRTSAPLEIRYVAKIDDPNYYDALFVQAFECALAMAMSKEITASDTTKQDVKADFKMSIDTAKATGAIEKEAEDFTLDGWLAARY